MRRARHAPVYAYRFDWASPLLDGALGSCHALELGFTFGTYRLKGAMPFFGSGPEADALSEAMMDAWINFAKAGNPSTDTTAWLRYDGGKRATMMFGDGLPHMAGARTKRAARPGRTWRRRRLGRKLYAAVFLDLNQLLL